MTNHYTYNIPIGLIIISPFSLPPSMLPIVHIPIATSTPLLYSLDLLGNQWKVGMGQGGHALRYR